MTDNRTTELREKLTERGIEYTTNDHMGVCETSWNGFTAMQLTPSAKLIMTVTPEQAIAATVGNGTCEMECEDNIEDMCGEHYVYFIGWTCSECGNQMTSMYESDRPKFCPECGAKVVKR